jgi:tetratricopeptide (TPR) repeat protein
MGQCDVVAVHRCCLLLGLGGEEGEMSRRFGRLDAGSCFVARRGEVAALRTAWESAKVRSARVVVIEGEPGIGKTALVDQLLSGVSAPVIRVSGVEAESREPWGVLTEILGQFPAESPADLVMPLDPQASPNLVGHSVAKALRSGTELVLVVDDAQWADQSSMAALRYAARRLRDDPVLLLVVFRRRGDEPVTGEPMTERSTAWRQLCGTEHGVHLRLEGLPPEDLMLLAAASGHPGLSPEGATRLYEGTGGNPGHVLELLEQLEMRSIVGGSGPLPAPRDRAAAVVSRLASCQRQTRELVAAGAVLGQRFSVSALRLVSGLERAGEYIAEAVEAGLLAEVPGTEGQELTFPRVATREAIYLDLGSPVRRDLHSRCAQLVGGPAALQHRIAATDGADEQLAADLQRAGHERMTAHDIPRAAFYLRQALDRTAPGATRLGRLLMAVESLLVAGNAVAASQYEGEVARAPAGPWRDYVMGYQVLLAGRVDDAAMLLQGALAALDRGELTAGSPRDLRARIATQLAIISVVTLSYPQMVEYGSAAVDAGSDEPWVRGFAWFAKTVGLALAGQSTHALDMLADVDDPGAASGLEGLVARGMIRLWSDDLRGAAQDLREVFDRAARGEVLRISQALGFLGEVKYRQGRLEEAITFTDLAVGNAEENKRLWDYPILNALASYPHAARADWTRAEDHARRSVTAARITRSRTGLAFAAGARAAIAQARGDAKRLLAAAEEAEANYDSLEPGTHLFGPVRADALSQLGRTEEAAQALALFLDGPARSGRRSALMSAARVAAQIALNRGEHDWALQECERASELARTIGLPLEEARIALITARCHSETGRHAKAERVLHAARKKFIQIGAHAYRQLAEQRASQWGITLHDDGPDPFAQLTRSERGVARLACKGRSTKKIAEELHLSEKTVETHLTHIYQKLDISSDDPHGKRAQLKALTHQDG